MRLHEIFIDESVYTGWVGIEELTKFFMQATAEEKSLFKKLKAAGDKTQMWSLVGKVLGVQSLGSGPEESSHVT